MGKPAADAPPVGGAAADPGKEWRTAHGLPVVGVFDGFLVIAPQWFAAPRGAIAPDYLVRGPRRGIVKEFRGIAVTRDLTVTLQPAKPGSVPVLCGIEVRAE